MSRVVRTSVAAALVAAILWSSTATAAPGEPLKHITLPYPAKTPIVVQVNGFEQARDRLAKMLTKAMPEDAGRINQQVSEGLEKLLDGRKLTAVPKDGRVFLVVQDLAKIAEAEPAVAVFVPVTGYKAFRDSFLTADEQKAYEKGGDGVDSVKTNATGHEATVYMVDLKEYVALTVDKGTADTYAGKFTRATTAALGSDLARTFIESDACLYVNMDAINEQYGEQIRGFKGLLDFAFGQAGMGGMIPGLSKKQLEGMKVIMTGVFQGVEDCRGLVAGVEFRPEGLNGRFQARFAPDSTTAGILKTETPAALAEIGKFPRGLGSYTGSRIGKRITDVMKLMAGEFSAAEDDEAGNEAIDKLLADIAKAGPSGEFGAASPPETAFSVTNYKEPAKAIAALTKLYSGMPAGGKIATVVLKEKPGVREAAQSHRNFKFMEVNLSFDFEATVAALPEQVKESTLSALKRVLKERTTTWIGTDGKVVASIVAKDWASARGILDDYLDGKTAVSEVAGFKLTRQNLPATANMISLSETSQLIVGFVEQMKAVGDQVPGFPALGGIVKSVQGEPTYVGFAVTLKGDTATIDGFMPGSAISVAKKMLQPLFKNVE